MAIPLVALSVVLFLQAVAPTAVETPPQVTISPDGRLAVYYPGLRQVYVYQKMSQIADETVVASELRLAQAKYELAAASGNPTRALEALKDLDEAKRKAANRPIPEPTYTCTVRYEIPPTPSLTLKPLACQQ